MKNTISVVVPCFNEASRLDGGRLLSLLDEPATEIVLVDDGSTDNTPDVLERIAATAPLRVHTVRLPENRGKGEAVRTGMLHAMARDMERVCFLDADLSTPPAEVLRIARVLDDETIVAALGSRVLLLGSHIERRLIRHVLGRAFATLASLSLELPVYDTQCGAKAFRCGPALEAALAEPFQSRWAFDVELLARLLRGGPGVPGIPRHALLEVPLLEWRDVRGSKLRAHEMIGATMDVVKIGVRRRR